MKPNLSKFLGIALAIIAILLCLKFRDNASADSDAARKQSQTKRAASGAANPHAPHPPGRRNPRPDREESGSSEISAAELENWLAGLKGDTRTIAEAYATVGLLNDDSDLIRKALEMDPENPLLLYIGAARGDFSNEERLSLAERFHKQDPENAIAAYLYSAQLLKSGDREKGLEILRDANERRMMDDFNGGMSVMIEDAYAGAGMSRDDAKLQSITNLSLPYISDFISLAASLNDSAKASTPAEAAKINALTAAMGKRIGGQAASGTLINQLLGLKIEEKTLLGLPDDAPSPYQGLTVAEARESIAIEREDIKRSTSPYPELETLLPGNAVLTNGFVERFRALGEVEAVRWLREQTGGAAK